jgi:hypothetical protein
MPQSVRHITVDVTKFTRPADVLLWTACMHESLINVTQCAFNCTTGEFVRLSVSPSEQLGKRSVFLRMIPEGVGDYLA